jgi:hypothetical protein
MLFTPRRLLKAIGVRDDRRSRVTVLAIGVRELVAAQTILGMRHRRVGAVSRAVGDTIDLTLLGTAFATKRADTARLFGAIGFVASILGADAFTAFKLSRAEGTEIKDGSSSFGGGIAHKPSGGPAHVRTAITVRGSEEEVREAARSFEWRAFDAAALEAAGELRFVSAPGDRGVELHVDHDPSVPAGSVGATALKLAGQSPDQKINDDLRRFKALFETGVEVRSDKTPEPFSARRQIMQRPAQPVGGKA